MIDWKRVSAEEFEKLCTELLELNGFENIQWYGSGGGDKGRDIVATKIEERVSTAHWKENSLGAVKHNTANGTEAR